MIKELLSRHHQVTREVTAQEAERDAVLKAFKGLYLVRYHNQGDDVNGSFRKLEAGVKLATDQQAVNPYDPIPRDYQGDGSFQVTWQTASGEQITQTEYIPWCLARFDRHDGYFDVLFAHSQPFKASHPEHDSVPEKVGFLEI